MVPPPPTAFIPRKRGPNPHHLPPPRPSWRGADPATQPEDASHPVQNRISLTRGVPSILRPHTPISSQLTHGTSDRAYTPPHCVLIERLETNGRGAGPGGAGVASHPADRADRAGSFLGPGSGAGDGHDRPSSRSGWADRRPIPPERRRASIQGSHLSPLTVRAPGSRGGTKGPLLRRTNRLDPWSRLAAPLPTGRRSILKPGSLAAARRVRSSFSQGASHACPRPPAIVPHGSTMWGGPCLISTRAGGWPIVQPRGGPTNRPVGGGLGTAWRICLRLRTRRGWATARWPTGCDRKRSTR